MESGTSIMVSFSNMLPRVLFPRVMFFAGVNHLSRPARKPVNFKQVEMSCLPVVIGRLQSILFVSVIQGSLAYTINVKTDGSKQIYFVVEIMWY